jgi:hypothetical protein
MLPTRFPVRAGLAALLPLQLLFPALAQAPGGTPGAGPPAAVYVPGTACQSAGVQAALLQRETNLLGRTHAEEHAHMRMQQCEAERGLRPIPAKGPAASGPATLQEDAAVLSAAEALAAGKVPTVSASAARAAKVAKSQGRWSDPFTIPVVGVTSVLLHTGKVLFWSYDPADYMNPANSKNGVAYVWDPATRTGHSITPPENIWCAGQTVLADGRVFLAGGNLRYPDPNASAGHQGWEGTLTTYNYVPATETFVRQPNMVRGRWYPTTTKLADNRVVITSGYDETGTQILTNNVEIFTASADPYGMGSIQQAGLHDASGLYPLQYLLQSGSMLEAGPHALASFLFDPILKQWTRLSALRSNHYQYGNGIIYTDASGGAPKQLVMVAGGHTDVQPLAANEWLDGYNPVAGWRFFPQWLQPRHNGNTVILPDGKLLTMGGNRDHSIYGDPLLQAEMYSAEPTVTTGQWQTMDPHSIQAAYHSTAILLPDATVLLSQDDMDHSAAAAAQHKVQVYSPPYLFKGSRPNITSAPASVSRGQAFSVATDRSITSAILIAPGATTHGNDMHQRAIRLPIQPFSGGLTATVPNSAALVPPGYYMLFVLDSGGVPSVARFVRVL